MEKLAQHPHYPRLTKAQREKYKGHTVISLNGKPIAFDLDGIKAIEKAKQKIPNLMDTECAITRVPDDSILICIPVRFQPTNTNRKSTIQK